MLSLTAGIKVCKVFKRYDYKERQALRSINHILAEECSTLVMKKNILPHKMGDIRSASFPYIIGSIPIDRSVKHPKSIIEDILVKVKDLVFSVDFVVLDIEDGVDFHKILCHPFLRTSGGLIDIEKGKLVLRFGGKKIVLKFPLLPTPTSKSHILYVL